MPFCCTLIPVIYSALRYRHALEMVPRIKCFTLCFKALVTCELFGANNLGGTSLQGLKGGAKMPSLVFFKV